MIVNEIPDVGFTGPGAVNEKYITAIRITIQHMDRQRLSFRAEPDPAPTERGGVTHISKDNVREIVYHQADCIVFYPNWLDVRPLRPPWNRACIV